MTTRVYDGADVVTDDDHHDGVHLKRRGRTVEVQDGDTLRIYPTDRVRRIQVTMRTKRCPEQTARPATVAEVDGAETQHDHVLVLDDGWLRICARARVDGDFIWYVTDIPPRQWHHIERTPEADTQ